MRGVYMKKIILAVTVISLAAFFVTCDEPIVEDDAIVEYSDVVYSPDGSQVTIYLDGKTVPVTKAQRAMSRDLAMMAYDYLEVIFKKGTDVARTNWELGYPAGINLPAATFRDAATTNYNLLTNACLFAGKKSDKTLFGIGRIQESPTDTTAAVYIADGRESVTFYISAIQTGLIITGEVVPGTTTTNPRGAVFDSFDLKTGSKVVNIGGVNYPQYDLGTDATVAANYVIGIVGNNTDNFAAVKQVGASIDPPVVQRRVPRFMEAGTYKEIRNLINTKTKVAITGASGSVPAANAALTAAPFSAVASGVNVPLTFTNPTGATGFFSFYLEIPVYMLDKTEITKPPASPPVGWAPVEGWKEALTWYIRTGYGAELYSIDDGASSGGCVLLGRGAADSTDWLNIEWRWLQ